MTKKRKKQIKVSLLKVIIKWFQLSIDEAMTIGVWILAWSMLEPIVMKLSIQIKALLMLLLIILLQRDVTNLLRIKKKK